MTLLSALADQTRAQDAQFADFGGWSMPASYGQVGTEYENARNHAVIFDIAHHGKVVATGKEAARFLHNLCTNDVAGLQPNRGCEAFFTTGQAKIAAYGQIYRLT